MDNKETESGGKRRLQKKSGIIYLLPLILVILFILGGYFLFFSESAQKLRPELTPSVSEESLDTPPMQDETKTPSLQQDEEVSSITDISSRAHEQNIEDNSSNAVISGSLLSDAQQKPPATGAEQTAGLSKLDKECQSLADNVEQFFNLLDTREYLKPFDIKQKSSVYFPRLIQRLVDNPPIVSGETDDLFTILQNTAHFFRIIGKNNILILKGILDREKATFEQTLSDFYELTKQPDCLKERFGLTIDKEPLYRYAGFFINTMGGRLYLFRRDSMSRMVVGYYGILVIDQANREGRNSYGIEIKTNINRLIEDIESSNVKLQMRDRYLDTLYSLKEKYQ